MITRRRFLEAGAVAGVGAMLPIKAGHAAEQVAGAGGSARAAGSAAAAVVPAVGVSPVLQKYLDALPLPGAFSKSANPTTGALEYYIAAMAFKHQFHSQLSPTPVWGYQQSDPNGNLPASPVLYSHGILENCSLTGAPNMTTVHWLNGLRKTDVHPVEYAKLQRGVTIDRTNVGGMKDAAGNPWPDQRIATHLHGGHVSWQSDGGPKTWYTGPYFNPNPPYGPGNQVIADGFNNGDTYLYPNDQPASTLWFHDHAMGITRYNVYAGLASFYLLENQLANNQFNLPFGTPIVIQDRIFNAPEVDPADGAMISPFWYPPAPIMPEFFGDTIIVNGKAWPKHQVPAGHVRLRLLNGCNARFLRLQFVVAQNGMLPSTRSWVNLPFTQIGAEGGLLPAPVSSAATANVLLLAPAERADVIVDFSRLAAAGGQVILYNDASTPFSGTADTRGAIPEIMRFDVAAGAGPTITLPTTFAPYGGFVDQNGGASVAPNAASQIPTPKVLTEIKGPNGTLIQLITSVGGEITATAPATATGYDEVPLSVPPIPVPPDVSKYNTTELWQIVNATVDTHPIHMHQSMFQVVGRYKFGTSQYIAMSTTKAGVAYGNPMPFVKGAMVPPEFNETGWKDTVRANPDELTLIRVKWVPASTDSPDAAKHHYVYHCHILEHEEHDMMRAMDLVY